MALVLQIDNPVFRHTVFTIDLKLRYTIATNV